MPPFLKDRRFAADILTAHATKTLLSGTAFTTIKPGNSNDAITQQLLPRTHSIAARSTANTSTTIGIVLGSIAGFLVVLTIIYVCYFRHYSTMYIVSRRSSATSSKASQKSKRRKRRRQQPIIAGLPRPREVFIVDVMRTRTSVPAAAAAAEPAAEAPAG